MSQPETDHAKTNGKAKWSPEVEQDLLMCMLINTSSLPWDTIHSRMTACGHVFTKDAISQHYSKFMLKKFRDQRPEAMAIANSLDNVSTPKKKTTPRAKTTPASQKRGKAKATAVAEDPATEEDSNDVEENDMASPSKKPRV